MMSFYSCIAGMRCAKCQKEEPVQYGQTTCECGGPLMVQYDLERAKSQVTVSDLIHRTQTIWRYHELLPILQVDHVVSLHEPMTPLIAVPEYGRKIGLPSLLVKDEGVLPSGTFKARGAAVGMSKVKEMGLKHVAIATNGNAGAAWALYGARAGVAVTVATPTNAPITARKECVISGADLFTLDGTIGDAGVLMERMSQQNDWYHVSTLHEPYRLEGKKTMGYEIAEQFGWSVPDVLAFPTGGGIGIIAIYKALAEMREMGWIGDKLPRIALIQSSGCAPLVRAFEKGVKSSAGWEDADTIAFGMRVPNPSGDFLILDIVEQSGGIAIAVDDSDIMETRRQVAELEGLHVCPEGAAALEGVRQLRESGWIRAEERVLVMNTGSGLKYIDQIEGAGQLVEPSTMKLSVGR
nr:threonine synthase [Alicyclobacillus sp. SP_1]